MTLQEAKDQVANLEIHASDLYGKIKGFWEWKTYVFPTSEAIQNVNDKAAELYASSQSAALKEINRELSNQVNALRTSAHFQSDNDVEANLRNQVFRLQLEIEQLKAVNKELVNWLTLIHSESCANRGQILLTSMSRGSIESLISKAKELKNGDN